MRNFRKALLSTLCVALVIFVFVSLGIEYNVHSNGTVSNHDIDIRKSHSGKIDTVFLGASHTQYGFQTSVADEMLNCYSYNISGGSVPFSGRYLLLKEELKRNPIKNVILDVYSSSFLDDFRFDGYCAAFTRLDSFSDRLKYTYMTFDIDNSDLMLGQLLLDSKKQFKKNTKGEKISPDEFFVENKGAAFGEANDMSIGEKDIVETYNSYSFPTDYTGRQIGYFYKIIDLCKENDINVMIAIIPVSDNWNWKINNFQAFADFAKEVCSKKGLKLYDFNLLKSRYSLFNDKESFLDEEHFSYSGSVAFTEEFCKIFSEISSGEDVSDLFYSSYEEMKQDSPYMEYYLAHKDDVK